MIDQSLFAKMVVLFYGFVFTFITTLLMAILQFIYARIHIQVNIHYIQVYIIKQLNLFNFLLDRLQFLQLRMFKCLQFNY